MNSRDLLWKEEGDNLVLVVANDIVNNFVIARYSKMELRSPTPETVQKLIQSIEFAYSRGYFNGKQSASNELMDLIELTELEKE